MTDVRAPVASRAVHQDRIVNERSAGEVKKVAKDFESLFLEIVLRSMRNTVPKSGLIDGGNAEDIYRSLLDSEYAKTMSSTGHSGLAAQIEKQILDSIPSARSKLNGALSEEAGKKLYSQLALPNWQKDGTISK